MTATENDEENNPRDVVRRLLGYSIFYLFKLFRFTYFFLDDTHDMVTRTTSTSRQQQQLGPRQDNEITA